MNAPYAIPHKSLPIKDVKERFFQWRGAKCEGLSHTLKQIKTQQNSILELCTNNAWLSQHAQLETAQYLNEFFNILDEVVKYKGEDIVSKLKNPKRIQTPA